MHMDLMIPVSWGELLDKLTILQIKKERIENPEKLVNISKEYDALDRVRVRHCNSSDELDTLVDGLRMANEKLWEIEDAIRECEREKDFGSRFIELARSVYKTNDRRARLKYLLNELLGSELVEEKSYEEY